MRFIAFSDSHGNSANINKVLEQEPHDFAVHMGDHLLPESYMNKTFKYWVAGNNDDIGPDFLTFEVENKKVFITHGHLFFNFPYIKWMENLAAVGKKEGAALVLFGHSHCADYVEIKNIIVANPGSIAYPRVGVPVIQKNNIDMYTPSYMVVNIEKNNINIIIKNINNIKN